MKKVKLLEKVKSAKILKGYVENRTKEATLAGVLTALAIVATYIDIPVFIYPLAGLDTSIVFWSMIPLLLSFPYVFLVPLVLSLTVPIGFLCAPGIALGQVMFYFTVKFIGLKRGKYLVFLASIYSVVFSYHYLTYIGVWNSAVLIPVVTKSLVQGLFAVILVPLLINKFEEFGVIELEKEVRNVVEDS